MKKLVIIGSACLFSLSLVGCQTMDNAAKAGGSVVDTGVHAVSYTGHAVGSTIGSGVNFLTGHSTTQHGMHNYHKNGIVYHNGHQYRIQHGQYVLIR